MLFLIYLLTCSAPVLSFLFILKQWLVVKFKFYHLYDFCACANKRISSCSRLPPGVTIWCSCYFLIKHFQNQISSHLKITVIILISSCGFEDHKKLRKCNIWSSIIFENKVSKTSFVFDQRGVTQPQMSSASDIMMYSTLNIETLIFLWKSDGTRNILP